jgi:hypothetical protein
MGCPKRAAFRGWKVQDAIEWFHGIGRLGGELRVETRKPGDCRTLGVGELYRINAGHAHQTSNRGGIDCRFLIVQGVGRYDFKDLMAASDGSIDVAEDA